MKQVDKVNQVKCSPPSPTRGLLNEVFYGMFHPKVQPLTLLYTIFDRRGTNPFRISFIEK